MNTMGPTDQPYMGVAEVAAYRHTSKQSVVNWRARGKMPKPVVTLRMGPIWLTETIVNHFKEQ